MKKSIFIIVIFALILLVGCETKYERTIWVNPDVECCGVKDPLNNLEWLKEWYGISFFNEERRLDYEKYAEFIFVYNNKSSSDQMIVRKVNYHNTIDWYYVYYCNGEILTDGTYYDKNIQKSLQKSGSNIQYTSTDCPLCEEFFDTYVLIDTIAVLYTDKFNF